VETDVIEHPRDRRPILASVVALAASAAPLLVLVVPAALRLSAVEPLLQESQFFPGLSRATVVAVPLVGLVALNLAIAATTRSVRSTLMVAAFTVLVAAAVVLGAVGIVEDLDALGNGVD
jgi:hypothetical protein